MNQKEEMATTTSEESPVQPSSAPAVKKVNLIKGLFMPRARGAYVAQTFTKSPLYQKIFLGIFALSTLLITAPAFGAVSGIIAAASLPLLLWVFAFTNYKMAHMAGSKEKTLGDHWVAALDLFSLSMVAMLLLVLVYAPLSTIVLGAMGGSSVNAAMAGPALNLEALTASISHLSIVAVIMALIPLFYLSYLSVAYIAGFVGKGYGYGLLAFVIVAVVLLICNVLLQLMVLGPTV